ncbi:hypothetical protein SCHPADRAFT_362806 [Schizopora paradoxa]|uniref:Uncharacterized protein n=1 Tax=Schizopora paradoxa TaxID=27342 RepID=A0A0H2RPG4_9AGAM|nr:hypothetical protein SCHPADRAFT_362806 [Schizopora paradoxa]
MLRSDLLVAVRQDRNQGSEESTSKIEMTKALYKELETTLGEFAVSLADGMQGKLHAPAGASRGFRIPSFFRRFWSHKAEKR